MKQTDKKHYDNVHNWIKSRYGKADMCQNILCNNKSKKYHWALKEGCSYEKNVNSFIKLCVSCHKKYDMTDSFIKSKCKKIKSIDNNGSESVYESLSEASLQTNTIITGISNVLNGRAKTSNKLKWFYA